MKNQIENRLGTLLSCALFLTLGFIFISFQAPYHAEAIAHPIEICPEASYSLSAGPFYAPSEISFTNQSAHAISYQWDFGDGQSSTDIHPRHTYQSAGTYEVTLTAVYSNCTDSFIGIVDLIGS